MIVKNLINSGQKTAIFFAKKINTLYIINNFIVLYKIEDNMKKIAISLFSSSGIGDLGLKENDIETVIGCELIKERMQLFAHNYPNAKCFNGNIWDLQNDIIEYYKSKYKDVSPFLLIATPPCQGMSQNGMGKMLNDFRKGLRPKMDERNRLIIPAIEIIKKLEPEWIIFENVPNMLNTIILDKNNKPINIITYINSQLSPKYIGVPEIIDVADYGIPQHRKRLIIVLTKTQKGKFEFNKVGSLLPQTTHSEQDSTLKKHWITLKEAIGNLPPLRAELGKNIDKNNILHKVPILDNKKLFWLDNTPEGETAFNNQCINPKCMFSKNKKHGSSQNSKGINKYNSNTPLYCEKCGALLPRPYVEIKDTNEKRLMKGYTSAYKRMSWNAPASTLTQNFQFACSDNKVHPSQSRVLSLYEGLILQSISNYSYSFMINNKLVSDSLIRETIGESVPPKMIDLICKHIIKISNKN